MDLLRQIKKYFFEFTIIILLIILYRNYANEWIKEWSDFDSFYAFGFFVLAFIAYLIKKNINELINTPKQPFMPGILILVTGLVFYVVGVRTEIAYFTSISLPVFIAGIILSIYGLNVFRKLLIPLFLFSFTLPIFPLHKLTMPLQLFSAEMATNLIKSLGVAADNQGSILFVNGHRLSVTPGCSGLKSLFSIFFGSIIYSYFINNQLYKKIIFVALSIPFALVLNILRISSVGFYALYNGHNGVMEFHDNAGIVVYVIAITAMVLTVNLLNNELEKQDDEI